MGMNVDPFVVEKRFLSNTKIKSNGCIEWNIGLSNGYGRFGINRKRVLAHRFSYMWFKGTIDDGMVINHKCRNKKCVNPEHLEQTTVRGNTNFHYNGYGN